MKFVAAVIAWILLGIVASSAGPFEDAKAAYDRADYAKAHDIWLPLAKLGSAKAQFGLAGLYAEGKGLAKDEQEAYAGTGSRPSKAMIRPRTHWPTCISTEGVSRRTTPRR